MVKIVETNLAPSRCLMCAVSLVEVRNQIQCAAATVKPGVRGGGGPCEHIEVGLSIAVVAIVGLSTESPELAVSEECTT
jgi:hypothetical protein